VVLAGAYLLHAPNALNTPVYVGSDGWVFNSIFVQVSRGARLYADIFDIKDPLYYYAYSVFERIFGFGGPMLCETLISLSIIAVLLAIGRHLRLPTVVTAMCAGICLLYLFSPAVYFPLNTYQFALLLFFTSLLLAMHGRYALAGGFFAATVFAKMPMVTFAPAAVAIPILRAIPDWSGVWRHCRGWLVGVVTFTAALVCTLAIRGELFGYFDVIGVNLAYSAAIQRDLGFSNHPFHSFEVIMGTLCALVMLGLTIGLTLIVLIRVTRQFRAGRAGTGVANTTATGVMAAAVLAGVGGAAILHVGSWFIDYFECLTPVFFLLPISVALWLRSLNVRVGGHLARTVPRRGSLSLLGVASLGGAMVLSGFVEPAALAGPPQPVSLAFTNVASIDPSVSWCFDGYSFAHRSTTFASVGANEFSAECLVPANMHLVCRLFLQFPWFGSGLLDEFKSCLATKPEVVFVVRLIYSTPSFVKEVTAILNDHFEEIGSCPPFEIWQRRPGK